MELHLASVTFLVVACAYIIGAVPDPIRENARQSKIYSVLMQDRDYWESVNSAEYEVAARDCRDNGDTLLFIEDKEKVNSLNSWLQDSDTSGTLYWVGGKFDEELKTFIWENNSPLGPDIPWALGEPNIKLANANTRIAVSTIGGEIQLQTAANTTLLRYICKYL